MKELMDRITLEEVKKDMSLKVTIKQVYGNELVYPHCELSQRVCKIQGVKTFTPSLISLVKALGYSIEIASSHGASL